MFKQFNSFKYYLYLLCLIISSAGMMIIRSDNTVVTPILSFAVAILGLSNVYFTYQGLQTRPVNINIAKRVGINTGISTILLFIMILFFLLELIMDSCLSIISLVHCN